MRIYAFGKSGFHAARLAGLACLVTAVAASSANAANNVGWVLADQPDSPQFATYTPNPKYSFNSAGGSISVGRSGVGTYGVYFENIYIGAPDNVQVTAYNTSGWCNANGLTSQGATVQVGVACYNAAGQLADASFTLVYQSRNAPFGGATKGEAYFFDDNPTNKLNAGADQSFNSTSGNNMVKANSIGNYTATLPGLTKAGGEPQVTGIRLASDIAGAIPRCKLATWSTGASSTSVTVHCYDTTGRPKNGGFYLAYSVGQPLGSVPGFVPLGAWAWADYLESTTAYKPTGKYQYNGFVTGPLTAQKTGTGLYTVTIPGTISYGTSVALVTAQGADNRYCNLAGWTTNTINVACFAQGGAPADSKFEVSFQTAN
jgi:hypothetical protein